VRLGSFTEQAFAIVGFGRVGVGAGYGWTVTNSALLTPLAKTLTNPVGVIFKTMARLGSWPAAKPRSATKRLPNASKAKPRRSPSPTPEAKVVCTPLGVIFTILPPIVGSVQFPAGKASQEVDTKRFPTLSTASPIAAGTEAKVLSLPLGVNL